MAFASSLMARAPRSRSRMLCVLRRSRLNSRSIPILSKRYAVIMKRKPRSNPRSAKPQRTVSIVGTGSYVPERRLTNDDLSKLVQTDDKWITTRTGIKERRIAADDEYTSDMGAKASLAAMEQAGVAADEIDLILVAT